ncbi:transcriptional regulator, LysR family [Rhizobiales bacterium GAS191]|jgi:LysR family glycine cleavage system transcriptional activator|nr:transcriptional regulator, LysR family [Rhizobiales bacterium GAS113]SEC51685.1 transcriptional regulator, LysR family [Rhizobiales bacterium GAS191]
MHKMMPQLNALRAFEAAARHLSLTKAAQELHVTAGALSHQIRALEELLGLKLFERRVRSIALTRAGTQLYPGLHTGFIHIRDAVDALNVVGDERVLVISTPPGFTAKWLAPRLYRFSSAHPEIDARVSSSLVNANFVTDGVDVAVRNLPVDAATDPELVIEKLIDVSFVPVCNPRLIEAHGPFRSPEALKDVPLIHDDSLAGRAGMPGWADWLEAAGVDGIDVSRGLRFNSADHALDATVEGAGVLLAHDVLAYDDLRTGRLVAPFKLTLRSGRAYCFVCARRRQDHPKVRAFRDWIKLEVAALDWDKDLIRRAPSSARG